MAQVRIGTSNRQDMPALGLIEHTPGRRQQHESTTDQEALQAWYVKTFGATAGKRGNFPGAMIPGGEVDFSKAQQAQAPTKGRTLDHIGFEVKGLEAFCKKLQADGANFDMAYRELPQLGGLKIAFIIDPIGTRIELTEGLSSH